MNTTAEASSRWRDIVNYSPDMKAKYNNSSLADYVDLVRDFYTDLQLKYDLGDQFEDAQALTEIEKLFTEYEQQVGEIGEIYISGNGFYLPNNTDEVLFFDGSNGISGHLSGFVICQLPKYQDLLYQKNSEYKTTPMLCIELDDFKKYSNTGIALEPSGGAIIPLVGQDLCFNRARHNY